MMEVTSPSPNRQNSLNARDLNQKRTNHLPRFLLGPKPVNQLSNNQKFNDNLLRQKSSSTSGGDFLRHQKSNNFDPNNKENRYPSGLQQFGAGGGLSMMNKENYGSENRKIGFSSNFQGILKKNNDLNHNNNNQKNNQNSNKPKTGASIPTASLGDYHYMNQSTSLILSKKDEKKLAHDNFLSNDARAFLESPIQNDSIMDWQSPRTVNNPPNSGDKKNNNHNFMHSSPLPTEPKNFSTPNLPVNNFPKSSLVQNNNNNNDKNNFNNYDQNKNDISPIFPVKEPGLKGFGAADNQHTPLARQMFEKKLNRQNNRNSSSNTNSQEDPILPSQFRKQDVGMDSPGMNHSGYSLDDELACWTTIFGFNSKNLDLILRKIFSCGSIVSRYPSKKPGSNWLHLRFATANQAKRACSKYNNQIIELSNGASVLIGIVECVESKYILDYVKGEAATNQSQFVNSLSPNVQNLNQNEINKDNDHMMNQSNMVNTSRFVEGSIIRNAQSSQKEYEDDFLVPQKDNDGVLKKTLNYFWGSK